MADLAQPLPPGSSSNTTNLFGDPIDSHPTWFNHSSFLLPSFDPNAYIADLRTFVPFNTLCRKLRLHLSSLRCDLIDLINLDYADFVSLSTNLLDINAAVLCMRAPLSKVRDKIVAFRGAMEGSLKAPTAGLGQQAAAAEAREVLELLLDTCHVVSKVHWGLSLKEKTEGRQPFGVGLGAGN